MTEMVERVARAIAMREATIMRDADRSQQSADPRALARAAIEAMREPTEAMTSAAWNLAAPDETGVPVEQAWSAMIDEALKNQA